MNRTVVALFFGILMTVGAVNAESGPSEVAAKSKLGFKSISIDEDLDAFLGGEHFSCKGQSQGFAYCRPKRSSEIFRTYAGTKLSNSHIEFLDGKVSKFYLAIDDCGFWNYLGGQSYDQKCLDPVISAMRNKYGAPKRTVIGDNSIHKGSYIERQLLEWDLGEVEITLEILKEIGETVMYYKGLRMEGMGNTDRANVIEIRHKSRAGEIDVRVSAAQKVENDKNEEIERLKEEEQQKNLAAERSDL